MKGFLILRATTNANATGDPNHGTVVSQTRGEQTLRVFINVSALSLLILIIRPVEHATSTQSALEHVSMEHVDNNYYCHGNIIYPSCIYEINSHLSKNLKSL